MRAEIFKSTAKFYPLSGHRWYVRLRGGNNEVMTTSEGYTRKWNAKRAAKRMFPNVTIEELD